MGHLFSTPGGVLRAQHRNAAAAATAAEEDAGGDIWIVAGLGNPGTRYAGNRHNVSLQDTFYTGLPQDTPLCGYALSNCFWW